MSDPVDLRCESCAAPREIVNGAGVERCAYCGSVFATAIATPSFAGNLQRLESRIGSIDERLARLAAPGHAALRQTQSYSAGFRLLVALIAGFFFCPVGMIPALPFILVSSADPNNLIFDTFSTGVTLGVMLLSGTFTLAAFVSIVLGSDAPIRGYGRALRALFEGIGRVVLGATAAVQPGPRAGVTH